MIIYNNYVALQYQEKAFENEFEERLWSEINWEYMSEESEVDDETFNKHPLTFRSDGK